MNSAAVLQAINILLGITRLFQTLGINYQEIIDAQNASEDGELTDEQIQGFLDQSQSAVDDL